MQLLDRSEKGLAISDINLKNGTMTFNGDRIKATKYALLRPVQYKLAYRICVEIQNEKISKEDLNAMPLSTIDRIKWLSEKKLIELSPEAISTVQKAYAAALVWAGMAQKNFEINGDKTTTVPIQDLKEVTKVIRDFCVSL